jgi:hypothetical protein
VFLLTDPDKVNTRAITAKFCKYEVKEIDLASEEPFWGGSLLNEV